MMPDHELIAKRKKFGLVASALVSYGIGITSLVSDPSWSAWSVVGMVVVIIGPAGIVYLAWPGSGRLLAWSESDAFLVPARVRRRGGAPRPGAPGHALELSAETGRAPVTTGRWLAEAESLLFEAAPARRAKAVRSYLLCAPRLVVMMWLGGLTRRTWPHSRRHR